MERIALPPPGPFAGKAPNRACDNLQPRPIAAWAMASATWSEERPERSASSHIAVKRPGISPILA